MNEARKNAVEKQPSMDVETPMLRSTHDRWMFALLWRDVAKHEEFEGVEECPGCVRRGVCRG